MKVLTLLVAIAVLVASARGQMFVENGSKWITNPYPEMPPSCCRRSAVEVCSRTSTQLGWPFDPGCALSCSIRRGGAPPGYFECRDSVCLCYLSTVPQPAPASSLPTVR
ncbi:uncharacterized protein LOC126092371 isoform X2 [Schistocerca cancellata]|uniref:uncharacterized protein LOC126092371 isoform X2 n=1 Tax=Schistocerca cancellata TaxID=274614 RepID=UPI002118B147|nr:uncharacterized protein LOC126092371 isoform X2 [Schistocerca cancellata]